MELKIPYYKEYTHLVASFMEEMGRSHGANKEETMQLRLIGEEAFVFILNGIPKVGVQETFNLHCNEEEEGLAFYFSNHGHPMNARKIPEFDKDNANETFDALSLNIIRCFSHEFGYNNRGKDGWELLIRFHLKEYRHLALLNFHEQDYDEIDQEPFIVRRATEDDVPGIIDLVYNTYRYTYAKEIFYNDVYLTNLIREKRIISLIAVADSGQIVGHNAVLLDSPLLGEAGMAMVDPNYRKSRVFLSLVLNTAKEIKREYPKIMGYAKCVTSHHRSQAFVSSFTSTFLQLSVYSHASFIGIKGEVNNRESLIYSVSNFSNDITEKIIYVPEEHVEIIQQLLNKAKFNIKVLQYNREYYKSEHTQFHLETFPGRQFAEMKVETVGSNFIRDLQKKTVYLRQNGVITANLYLPTDNVFDSQIDSQLSQLGYFFSGFIPAKDGSWKVVYCNLLSQLFNFDNLDLFAPESKMLCEYIKNEYEKSLE